MDAILHFLGLCPDHMAHLDMRDILALITVGGLSLSFICRFYWQKYVLRQHPENHSE